MGTACNGGNWNNGVKAGARAVNVNNDAGNVNTNSGSRFACDSMGVKTACPRRHAACDRESEAASRILSKRGRTAAVATAPVLLCTS